MTATPITVGDLVLIDREDPAFTPRWSRGDRGVVVKKAGLVFMVQLPDEDVPLRFAFSRAELIRIPAEALA